jgi:hypothetical protein
MYEFTPDISLPPHFYTYTMGPKLISTLLLLHWVAVEHLHQPLQGVQIHPEITESKLYSVLTPLTKSLNVYSFFDESGQNEYTWRTCPLACILLLYNHLPNYV